jgi:hypothetical protein
MAIKPNAVYYPSHSIGERLGGGPFTPELWLSLSFINGA